MSKSLLGLVCGYHNWFCGQHAELTDVIIEFLKDKATKLVK